MSDSEHIGDKVSRAIGADDAAALADLLSPSGTDIDLRYRDGSGRSLLYLASERGSSECVRLLIARGANVHERRSNATGFGVYQTALLAALYMYHYQAAEMLLEGGASPNISTSTGYTPIHVLATSDLATQENLAESRLRMVEKLVTAGCPINERENSGATPLMLAIRDKQPLLFIEALLRNGADPNLQDPAKGRQALHQDWSVDDVPLIELLTRHGADVNGRDWKGHTPLYYAQDVASYQALVDLGADESSLDCEGRNVFQQILGKYSPKVPTEPILVHMVANSPDLLHVDLTRESAMQVIESMAQEGNELGKRLLLTIAAQGARQAIRSAVGKRLPHPSST